ncbi:hypothetical protein NGB58_26345 [Escherichia coli]|nr:hypothetical protein [Escherichia coli]
MQLQTSSVEHSVMSHAPDHSTPSVMSWMTLEMAGDHRQYHPDNEMIPG